jgi:hypothetical protein
MKAPGYTEVGQTIRRTKTLPQHRRILPQEVCAIGGGPTRASERAVELSEPVGEEAAAGRAGECPGLEKIPVKGGGVPLDVPVAVHLYPACDGVEEKAR